VKGEKEFVNYDAILETVEIESGSTAGPNFDTSELKLLMVPASARKAPVVTSSTGSLVLRRRCRTHRAANNPMMAMFTIHSANATTIPTKLVLAAGATISTPVPVDADAKAPLRQ